MGQASCRTCQTDLSSDRTIKQNDNLPDLAILPPEVAVEVLSHLDATDLCLASCVNELWCSLANVEVLWKRLCMRRWGYVSAYFNGYTQIHSFKELYMILDNGTLSFAADPNEGLSYLIKEGVLTDDVDSIAQFIHNTDVLSWLSLEQYLMERTDILKSLVSLHDFTNQFLPDALRSFFSRIPAPRQRGQFLEKLLDYFSSRYLQCNRHLSFSKDTVYIICYSLILLSVDLTSPCVKNKMSKREFIKNLRGAATGIDNETLGHMYDNIYLLGHVATQDTCH